MRSSITALISALFLHYTPPTRAEPLATNFGVGTILHPIQEPKGLRYPSCYASQPCRCCKEKVHIFGINGLDPLCVGNFNGLCAYFKKQGFENTYFGQLHSSHWFAGKIRDIRRHDPQARVALIGFSLGAHYVLAMANALAEDGVRVDLLVYMVGDFVGNDPRSVPKNVGRVVNIRAQGLVFLGGNLFFKPEDIDGAYNFHLDHLGCRHIMTPNRRETVELMMNELMTLACFVTSFPSPARTLCGP